MDDKEEIVHYKYKLGKIRNMIADDVQASIECMENQDNPKTHANWYTCEEFAELVLQAIDYKGDWVALREKVRKSWKI